MSLYQVFSDYNTELNELHFIYYSLLFITKNVTRGEFSEAMMKKLDNAPKTRYTD